MSIPSSDPAASDSAASDPAASDSAASDPPDREPVILSESDSGRSVTLLVGGEAALRLSHDYTWDEPSVDGEGLEIAPVDYLVDPGFSEWRISATRPGTAVVTAAGAPACTDADCPIPVRIEVRVTG